MATKKAETKTVKSVEKKATSKEFKVDWKNLVIVESPAKAKTINKFLGKWFDVKASMWHIVDLPQKKLWINIDDDFEPTYQISKDKKNLVAELKSLSWKYDRVWLATDEDREWEAIAWHILRVLDLDEKTTPRIVFHEITKEAIQWAISSPRTIDMNLVNAQQWRRLLDRLVWFSISPVLWKKINKWLSAWRVQSVAVKLIVEKEREIQNFKPVESWKLKAQVTYKKTNFVIEIEKVSWKAVKLKSWEDVVKVLSEIWLTEKDFQQSKDVKSGHISYKTKKSITYTLENIEKKDLKKSPSAPFITSTLQQEASRRFGRWVKQVMSVAQKLYENWFITYMRTDSVNLSWLAINAAKDYILWKYWEEYSKPRQYKWKSANAQEAHEAIRPTYLAKDPWSLWLWWQEWKLYSLIWTRTIASQMSDALLEATIYHFNPEGVSKQDWVAKWQVIKFPGFMKLYQKESEEDEENPSDDEETTLPKMKEWESVESEMIFADQFFSKPPVRYTEASLVKKLEWEWIWRPSTYAPTISTIQDRRYVVKDWKFLKPTDVAFTVNDFLEKYFKNLMDYKFTAKMEWTLDEISTWAIKWKKMLADFYKNLEKELIDAGAWEREHIYVWKPCPDCGAQLIYKYSKNWKFIWCENFPECKYTTVLDETKDRLAVLKEKYEWQPCPEWGTIVVKIWRFWPFLTSSAYPDVKRIKWIPDEKMEKLEEDYGGETCDKCGEWVMHVKKSRKGYFLACNKYPECKNAKNIKFKKEESKEE